MGISAKSWIVFGVALVLAPFAGELLIAKYLKLKQVGVKALRGKLHEKNS